MQYRTLGRSGINVSSIALGTDNFVNPTPKKEVAQIIDVALDAGINLIDTSDSYAHGECESVIGRVFAGNHRRNEVIISTKVHYPTGPGPNEHGNSRLHLLRACEDSLRRLKTDRIRCRREFPCSLGPGPGGRGLYRALTMPPGIRRQKFVQIFEVNSDALSDTRSEWHKSLVDRPRY